MSSPYGEPNRARSRSRDPGRSRNPSRALSRSRDPNLSRNPSRSRNPSHHRNPSRSRNQSRASSRSRAALETPALPSPEVSLAYFGPTIFFQYQSHLRMTVRGDIFTYQQLTHVDAEVYADFQQSREIVVMIQDIPATVTYLRTENGLNNQPRYVYELEANYMSDFQGPYKGVIDLVATLGFIGTTSTEPFYFHRYELAKCLVIGELLQQSSHPGVIRLNNQDVAPPRDDERHLFEIPENVRSIARYGDQGPGWYRGPADQAHGYDENRYFDQQGNRIPDQDRDASDGGLRGAHRPPTPHPFDNNNSNVPQSFDALRRYAATRTGDQGRG